VSPFSSASASGREKQRRNSPTNEASLVFITFMIISGYFLRISLFTIRRAGMKAGRKDGFLELFLFLLSGLFCFISSELVDAESEVPMEKLL
jgi:Na+/H+ antiporter NhaD/arsenite permease-like protein